METEKPNTGSQPDTYINELPDIKKLLAELDILLGKSNPGTSQQQQAEQTTGLDVDSIIKEYAQEKKQKESNGIQESILPETNTFSPDTILPELLSNEPSAIPDVNTDDSPPRKERKWLSRIGNAVFWIAIISAFFAVLIYSASGNNQRNILGFSVLEVLSDSMQSEIPKGSLVLVRETPAENLKIGDDITFLVDDNTTYTHRIIGIYENYEDSGQRGFETKGTENPLPDEEIVFAKNVTGKVVWHLPGVGPALDYISENWLFILIPAAALVIFIFLSKNVFSKENPNEQRKKRYKRRNEVIDP